MVGRFVSLILCVLGVGGGGGVLIVGLFVLFSFFYIKLFAVVRTAKLVTNF